MIKSGSKFIPLKTLKDIKENSYRTKCSYFEFSKHEIDDQINQKETKKMLSEHDRLMKIADNTY